MKIDHIGYAVRDINKAKPIFEELGYEFEKTVTDKARNIYISFGKFSGGGTKLNLYRQSATDRRWTTTSRI